MFLQKIDFKVYGLRKISSDKLFWKWEFSVRHTSIDVLHFVSLSDRHNKSQDRITSQCWKHNFLWPTSELLGKSSKSINMPWCYFEPLKIFGDLKPSEKWTRKWERVYTTFIKQMKKIWKYFWAHLIFILFEAVLGR